MIKRLLAPAQRRRPDAICFCFVGCLSPQAKDLCGKLSTNDNITLSPAVGGRKKRNRESGQLQRQDPQKQIGRTFSGENSLFSPLARSRAGGQTPITLFRYSDQAQILFSKSASPGSKRKKNLVGLTGENPVSPLSRKGQEGTALASHSPF